MGGKKSNHVRRLLRSFGAVQNWQLLLILIPLLFVTATLLRLDHLRMAELRDAVISADNLGDDELLQEKLQALQEFTFKHVVVNIIERNGTQNLTFGTGPFYLEGQYLRAANEAIAEAESQLANDSNPNGNIYAAVSAVRLLLPTAGLGIVPAISIAGPASLISTPPPRNLTLSSPLTYPPPNSSAMIMLHLSGHPRGLAGLSSLVLLSSQLSSFVSLSGVFCIYSSYS